MRVYDWIAPAGTDPHAAMLKAQVALGVKLEGSAGEVHGYVNTSRRSDGSVYVCVHLYDVACVDPGCGADHMPIRFAVAPAITAAQLAACKVAIGEHAQYKLGVGRDDAVLSALGFAETDGARR